MTTVDELTRAYGPPPEPEPERPRMSRGKRLALFVAFLIALPAIALAATYLWGTITGSTSVVSAAANVTITNVTGSDNTGAECGTSKIGNTPQDLAIIAKAYRVDVNGVTPPPSTVLGTCTIAVTVANTGEPGSVSALVSNMPTGWTFDAEPPVIVSQASGPKVLTITLTAKGNAASGTSSFSGSLNIDIPPNGSAITPPSGP